MTRAEFERASERLIGEADRQREALRSALVPWQRRARRADALTQPVRRHARLFGFLAGFGAGLLVAFKPRWPVLPLRALWRLGRGF